MFCIAVSYESSKAARLFRVQLAGVCNLEVAEKMRSAALRKLQTDHGVTVDARYLENEIGVLMPERE
jgi:hypothetical protein